MKDYIILIFALLVVWILCKWDNKEGFTPKYWRPRKETNWDPMIGIGGTSGMVYHQNEYHPAVPEVSKYTPDIYKFPWEIPKYQPEAADAVCNLPRMRLSSEAEGQAEDEAEGEIINNVKKENQPKRLILFL